MRGAPFRWWFCVATRERSSAACSRAIWSREDCSLADSSSSKASRGVRRSSGSWPRAISIDLLFKPRRGLFDPTRVKVFVEMGEFSPGVLEEEFADENECGSKHVDGQKSDVAQDGCRIFAPKKQLVRVEEFQFTHEPEPQGQQEGNGDEKGVCDHSWFLSVGKFKCLFPKLPDTWEQGGEPVSHRGSPDPRRLFRWRPPMEKTGA